MSNLKMTALNVGPLDCDKNLLAAFAPGRVEVPTTAAVIVHPAHGIIVWDTGINDAVADPDREYWGPGLKQAFGTHGFTRGHAIDAQLDGLGIKPSDVKYVIYSHLHLDHAGGMSYFPNATHVVQRDEIRYALWPDAWTRPVYCQNDFKDIHKLNFFELEGDCDLFSDGSLYLMRAPGHSPGQQVLIVNLQNRGKICLGADTGHQRDAYENMVPMPWDWSASAVSTTRSRMKQLERSGVPLFLCHDADDFSKLPQAGQFWD
ncbi:N-acyl homoserine lactonase family protein [Rhizobium fabae]|uniref:quorum-quenching N-acyl-homoserine lactonase n=1 Tax=Rhizobium fabae TaxID=573179 RepID=A0A7W6BEP1_9HYPH|nr:N-acyl homoserine lactonase family protein [Rhizobium fabae]MBB3917597.1 glyoxylase-like metal-dependent hydrolase (beta-lactamase superfamily II) [Rhizobium fabae]